MERPAWCHVLLDLLSTDTLCSAWWRPTCTNCWRPNAWAMTTYATSSTRSCEDSSTFTRPTCFIVTSNPATCSWTPLATSRWDLAAAESFGDLALTDWLASRLLDSHLSSYVFVDLQLFTYTSTSLHPNHQLDSNPWFCEWSLFNMYYSSLLFVIKAGYDSEIVDSLSIKDKLWWALRVYYDE